MQKPIAMKKLFFLLLFVPACESNGCYTCEVTSTRSYNMGVIDVNTYSHSVCDVDNILDYEREHSDTTYANKVDGIGRPYVETTINKCECK